MSTLQTPMLDLQKFRALGKQFQSAYAGASPFPHIVIDDFLPPEILESILKEFPNPEQIDWKQYDNPEEKKLASRGETQMGDATRLLLYQLNSSGFLEFLETLTGIDGLISDPHFWGGGLHQIKRGGYLKVHIDFNYYRKLNLERRLNFLLYLNKDWQESYGGHLELWEKDMARCGKRILPIFNRCVVFSTTSESYHGHPEPLTCPEDRTRKSLALYYYSSTAAALTEEGHGTLFRGRPGEKIRTGGVKTILKKLSPPILVDTWRALKGTSKEEL